MLSAMPILADRESPALNGYNIVLGRSENIPKYQSFT
jgi:hypothetical protein